MAIAFVQSKTVNGTSAYVANASITPTSAFTAGNFAVIFVGTTGDTTTTTSTQVTDTAGNTWVRYSNISNTQDPSTLQVFYCASIAGGSPTITYTNTAPQYSQTDLILYEFSGVGANDVSPVSTAQNSYVNSLPTGSMTTTNANDLVFVVASVNDATTTLTATGYTLLSANSTQYNYISVAYKIVSSNGSQSATFTSSNYVTGIAAVYSFKAYVPPVTTSGSSSTFLMMGV